MIDSLSLDFINECLGSLLSQTFTNLEVIVVAKDVKPFNVTLPGNLRVFEVDDHADIFEAYNVGVALASGKYISFWQIPDTAGVNMFEVFNMYASQSDAEVIGTGKYFAPQDYGQEQFDAVDESGIEQGVAFNKDSRLSLILQGKITCHLHGKVFRRDFLLRYGIRFVAGNVLQKETLFVAECALKARLYLHIPDVLYFHKYIGVEDVTRFPTKDRLKACVNGLRHLDGLCEGFATIQTKTFRDFYIDAVKLKNIFTEAETEQLNEILTETVAEENKLFARDIHQSFRYFVQPSPVEQFGARYPLAVAGVDFENGIAYNVNQTNYEKRCLMIYIANAFYQIPTTDFHQNWWQNRVLAAIMGSFGYQVDVVDYRTDTEEYKDREFRHEYDVFLTIHIDPIGFDCLKPDCVKIAYTLAMSEAVSDYAVRKRKLELNERKGAEVVSITEPDIPKLERLAEKLKNDYDGMTMFGNDFVLQTFGGREQVPKKFHIIINNGYPLDIGWDFSHKRSNSFLFFASHPAVLKGLDVLLEVFGKDNFPAKLFVCSLFREEEDFCKIYDKELFHSQGVVPVGFIDIHSELFKNIINECSYVISASSVEGQAGAVTTAMSAGLIPIVSIQNGYYEEDVITLPDCEIPTIEKVVLEYSKKPLSWIRQASMRARKIVAEKYSRQAFIDSVYWAFVDILGKDKN